VREVKLTNFYANVIEVSFPALDKITIAGAISKGLFNYIKRVSKPEIELHVNKILIDNFKWNLSDPIDTDLVPEESISAEVPFKHFIHTALYHLDSSTLGSEIIDLSFFSSKSYSVRSIFLSIKSKHRVQIV
jgi:hypothetical protein